jgi:hypothetical protein
VPTTFDRISGWLTLAANLGVLGGIVLVILQLNQNERMIRAQTRHEIAIGLVEHLSETASDSQLSEIVFRAGQGGDLSPAERFQFLLWAGALLRLWEDEHYQYRRGLYADEEFSHERETWRSLLGMHMGVVAQWCRTRGQYSAEFATEVNALLERGACEAVLR